MTLQPLIVMDDQPMPTSIFTDSTSLWFSRSLLCLTALTLCLFSLCVQGSPTNFAPDRTLFANPERGWYHSFNPVGDLQAGLLDEDFLRSLKEGPDRVTLVRKYYLLKSWRQSALPADVLDELEQDFQISRRAGVKLVPRFVYHWLEDDGPSDVPLDRTLGHLEQIAPVLRRNADAMAWLQAGIVGKWGEWHSSSSGHVDNTTLALRPSGRAIRDKLLEIVPANRNVAMRYIFWHKIKDFPDPLNADTAHNGTPQARLGIYNDNMVNFAQWESDGDTSNYPPREKLNDYMRQDAQWVVQEGEPQSWDSSNYYASHNPLPELRALNFTAVNRNADTEVNDAWKRGGYWSALTRDLGYRLHLSEARLPDSVKQGNLLKARLELSNSGYAAPINTRPVRLVLVSERDGKRFDLEPEQDVDPRRWQRGEHSVEADFTLPAEMPLGRYRAHLWLPDASTTLSADPAYAIRLASLRDGASIHDEQTGLNNLFITVEVTS